MFAYLEHLDLGGVFLEYFYQPVVIVKEYIYPSLLTVPNLLPDELMVLIKLFMRTVINFAFLMRKVVDHVIGHAGRGKVIQRPLPVKISARARGDDMDLVAVLPGRARKEAKKLRLPHYRVIDV
jgi:hypothetical protein